MNLRFCHALSYFLMPHRPNFIFRCLCLMSLGCSIALRCPAQTKGTPLPGLKKPDPVSDKPAAAAPDIPALRKKADSGDPAAQLALADLIFSGAVKDAKPEEAAKLLETAADSGLAAAQFAFARLLQSGGAGVKPDAERAKFLIQQAAEAGHAQAQTAHAGILLGQIDPKARDVKYDEPLSWYRKAADKGDAEATCRLGMMQANGQGMPPDAAAAWKLISKAARTGNALALNEAGIMLQRGAGVEKDEIAAVGYFHAAADLGSTAGAVNLGLCYETGQGVPLNFANAGAAYARAAKAGNGMAQLFIGRLFEEGLGTEKNPVFAFVNYSNAALSGLELAVKARDTLKAKLTAAQLKEAAAMLASKEAP